MALACRWQVVVVMGAGRCTYWLANWLCNAGWLVANTLVSVCSWQSLTKPWFHPATLCCWDFLANTSEPRPQLASIALHNDCGVSGAFYPVQGAVTGIAAFALTLAVCTIASPGQPLLHSTPVSLYCPDAVRVYNTKVTPLWSRIKTWDSKKNVSFS